MDKQNQERIVNELIDNLRKNVLEKVEKFPEHWDGIEIRHFVADWFKQYYCYKPIASRKRKSAYLNEIYTRNLM